MPRCIRRAQLLLSAAEIAFIANVPATHAGCAPVPTPAGDIIVCDAAIPPNPSGPIDFLGGGDNVTVGSGTYGAFTFPSGNNTLIFGLGGRAPVIAGTVVFGAGAVILSIVMVRSLGCVWCFATRANLDSDHDDFPQPAPLWTP
jgi:hypothetical protein